MLNAFLKGIVLGVGLSFSIGPAFFALIQVGIQRGKKYGYAMAIGILLSDCTLIAISLLGFTSLLDNPDYTNYIGITGGIILVLYGIYSFFNPPKNPYSDNKESKEVTTKDIVDESAEEEIVKKSSKKKKKKDSDDEDSEKVPAKKSIKKKKIKEDSDED